MNVIYFDQVENVSSIDRSGGGFMDIGALSMMMSQGQVQQQAGVSVMKMAMDVASSQGDMMTSLLSETAKSLEMSVQPNLGATVDIRV